jgi:hypothetical protein
MQSDLIQKIARLMTEQAAAYTSLESLTSHLITALTRCEPNSIETLSRAGETELFRMRSRLLEITSALTGFAEMRANQTGDTLPLDTETRESFETAANKLLEMARHFEKTAGRATSLAHGGSSYANANIQMCGVPPTTYRPPVLNYGKGLAS